MAPQNSPRTDTKLLLSVAGVVVAGAIGIALVAGLAVRREASPVERAAPRAARASTPLTPRVDAPAVAPTIDEVAFATPADTAAPAEIPAGDGGSGAIEIDPQADPWREGNRAYHTHEYALAAAYFEADAVARPERAYTAYMLALARWKAADLDGAVEAMERSAALNARSVRTFVNLSRIHNARGDYESARQAAEQALTIQPDHAVAQYQLGRSLYNLGRVEEAVEALETCLTLDPAEADAHNLLGLIRLQRGDDVQALQALASAAALDPRSAYIQNNLGLALERNGRLAEAAEAFRQAVAIDAAHRVASVSLERVVAALPAEPIGDGDPTADTALAGADPTTVPLEVPPAAEPTATPAGEVGESKGPAGD